MTSGRVDVEGSGTQVRGDEGMVRPRAEEPGSSDTTEGDATSRNAEEPGSPRLPSDLIASRSAEDSGRRVTGEGSGSERESVASPFPDGVPAIDAAGPNSRAAAIRVTMAAAAAAFFGALYLAEGNGLLLAGASTALALVAYWLAEQELGHGGDR
jgi:hypothetical protein